MESFSKQFEGKIAVVTGGTQGLGAATAQLFADRGAAGLVICGRNTGKGQAAAASLVRDRCPTFFVKSKRIWQTLQIVEMSWQLLNHISAASMS